MKENKLTSLIPLLTVILITLGAISLIYISIKNYKPTKPLVKNIDIDISGRVLGETIKDYQASNGAVIIPKGTVLVRKPYYGKDGEKVLYTGWVIRNEK